MPKPVLPSIAVATPWRVSPPHPVARRLGRGLLARWHLLSLDAPTVAAFWTWYIAAAAHLQLPARVPIAMFVAVWTLYAADRLLDSRVLPTAPLLPCTAARQQPALDQLAFGPLLKFPELEARHIFHHRHRRPMIAGMACGALLLAALVPELEPAAIRLNLVLGSLLFAYFVLIHATARAHRLPKEISVGLFFSAAVFIPTVARAPQLRLALLPVALLFAVLCSLNCLLIYRWEHDSERPSPGQQASHWITHNAVRHLSAIALTLAALSLAYSLFTRQTTPLPIAVSALLLLGLDRLRPRLAPLTLRAAADLVLLTPVPLLLLRHLV